ncbi:cysteine--tRNA ligase [Amaricoccus sp.]|uniref:cysteine--tRNA ligase n=1 Tax=Amaricoccus sp. TaxID=1872485 RepID=UPI002C462A53|nr:cysteine--tRNA ligase [Amaricoccus sp.]HRW15776.1 cysteine--tRNA ligase [Amaricoccus sp.]
MTEITLYNTRTRRKDRLVPTDPGRIGMYVCGPTVYDRAHIGNARPVVVFDVLFRLLRHVYGQGQVTYVRNITDVDDKINARAAESGRDIRAITDETIRWYHEDMAALGALSPTREPRATEFIAPMVAMIETLIARGHAYAAEGHVLFSVASFSEYGRLARRSLDEMRAGARVEVAPYKRDPMDFVLWKPSEAGLPGWESPWGRGRPGWHIECSAMAHELLGPSFDIHGGGIDLVFPHHENEVAQSRCAHPEGSFANIWMHNGFLNVEGEKMSKSLGNFFTVRDLLDRGIPGEVIRFVLLSTHYRQPMDWTEEKVAQAKETLLGWYRLTDGLEADPEPDGRVAQELADDLNTPAAIAKLHQLASGSSARQLKSGMRLIGLPDAEQVDWFRTLRVTLASTAATGHTPLYAKEIAPFLQAWEDLRNARKYEDADRLKMQLEALGLRVAATKFGPHADVPHDFDATKLEALE